MSGGMEDTARYYRHAEQKSELLRLVSEYESKTVLDAMYKSYIECYNRENLQRNHPSREVYGQILEHARLWNMAVEQINKTKTGGVDGQQQPAGLLELECPAQSL